MSRNCVDPATSQPIPFTCANRQFSTRYTEGYAHGENRARGSVFSSALVPPNSQGNSLWLEHVTDEDDTHLYWLMWYDQNGIPVIPMSAVMTKSDLATMMQSIVTEFVPPERA